MSIKITPGLVLGIVAVVIAMVGTAFAATGQLVNITDGTDASRVAKVDATGKLLTGDGAGAMTVDGTTGRPTAPRYFMRFTGGVGDYCTILATAPADRALVIQDIHLNAWRVTAPGNTNGVSFWTGTSTCQNYVAEVNPGGVGVHSLDLDPGLTVPAGRRLFGWKYGDFGVTVFGTGYTVWSGDVPATASSASAQTNSELAGEGLKPPKPSR